MAERFWWVNHSQTARREIAGEYLWFAKGSRVSRFRSESYRNLLQVLPGDIVFSFADEAIGAVGLVLGAAREAQKPFEAATSRGSLRAQAGGGSRPSSETGWLMPIRFHVLAEPLRTQVHAAQLRECLPKKHSPLRSNGLGKSSVFFSAVPEHMATVLQGLLASQLTGQLEQIRDAAGRGLAEDALEAIIRRRTDLDSRLRAQLLKARHGHGEFRRNVEVHERACRITGLLDRRHLSAVHIKPWSDCDDREQLDGFNGLLLSPHAAHLFGRGYISFADDGDLLVSRTLNPAVLEQWSVKAPRNVGAFAPEQCRYLAHHRQRIFEQHDGGRRVQPPDGEQTQTERIEADVIDVPIIHPRDEPSTA